MRYRGERLPGGQVATGGEIDYTHYTREQLEDARWRIDRDRFPLNYRALMAEIERRRAEEAAAAAAAIREELSQAITRHSPQFRADPKEYFRIWIVNLALTILTLGIVTLGILMPRAARERYRFVMSRSRFGATPFDCNPGIGRFYKTVFGAMGLALGIGLIGGLLAAGVTQLLAEALPSTPVVRRILAFIPALVTYALLLPTIHGYTQARNLNEVFSSTSLGPHRFISRLSAATLIGLYLSNLALIVATLGLFTPWAQIRAARYRLKAIELEAHGSLDDFTTAAAAPLPSATGEELTSFLDVDFGF